MNILQEIVAEKQKDISLAKQKEPLGELLRIKTIQTTVPGFYESLKKQGPSIIAEFKRRSPSKGDINLNASLEETILNYNNAGASAISVLTDKHFGGSTVDFKKAAALSSLPLLRKDFIVDVYQIYESEIIGASAILLIASILEKEQMKDFYQLATERGLDVLFEVHNEEELKKLPEDARIIGINNRNLENFDVDIQKSMSLYEKLPQHSLKVSESGISDPETIKTLFNFGFDAFLIGEKFMKADNQTNSVKDFFTNLRKEN
jgi:indole-3-glycerol phosphate synthase